MRLFCILTYFFLPVTRGTRVCRDVTSENISVSLQQGLITLSLEDGGSFDSFCGDEVAVIMDGVFGPIVKQTFSSTEIVLDVNFCQEHQFKVDILEHTFPTISTMSPWILYQPQDWFNFDDKTLPFHQIFWNKKLLVVDWWKGMVLDFDFLPCLLYVEFLDQDGDILHSVISVSDLQSVNIIVDLCLLEWLEVRYTMTASDGQRWDYC